MAKIRQNFNKITEIHYKKPTNHFQTTLEIIQYYNQNSKPEKLRKIV